MIVSDTAAHFGIATLVIIIIMIHYYNYIPEFWKLMRYLINANFASHFAGAFKKNNFNLLVSSLVYCYLQFAFI